tara:strand:- start:454 stop:1011 length:558 start_codon:yes stop_codon:yes gene_type:complete
MNMLTHKGWETTDWEQGKTLPDHHTASLLFLHAHDLIPNMNKDDAVELSRLVESPVNESFQENDDVEGEKWRLTGVMLQKTTMVDTDPDNNSLAGESIEVNVVNEESESTHYELPVMYRRMIPIDRIKEMMTFAGVTGDARIPDEVLNLCDAMDIGVATEVLVTNESCKTFNDLISEDEVNDDPE